MTAPETAQLFDPSLGEYLKTAAIEAVEDHADPDWLSAALVAARRVCADREFFTTDRVWEALAGVEMPHEPRVMGALMRRVKALGWAVPTDRTRPSAMPQNHARPVRLWKSALV